MDPNAHNNVVYDCFQAAYQLIEFFRKKIDYVRELPAQTVVIVTRVLKSVVLLLAFCYYYNDEKSRFEDCVLWFYLFVIFFRFVTLQVAGIFRALLKAVAISFLIVYYENTLMARLVSLSMIPFPYESYTIIKQMLQNAFIYSTCAREYIRIC